MYNDSPLAKRLGVQVCLRDFAKKLKGMNGDHASNEKSTAKAMQSWKRDQILDEMGEDRMLEMEADELLSLLGQWKENRIADAGGQAVWDALSPAEQAERDGALMKDLKAQLGSEIYDQLSDQEKKKIDFFLWAGCAMHKDQNSFKGGNHRMMGTYERHKIPPPMTLANAANAALLRKVLDPAKHREEPLTETEIAALEASTRGGVKLTAIAGALFNNKDDKKGQGDTYLMHFKAKYGESFRRFPDTNNTRFGSHGEAAGNLLRYHEGYVEYMQLIRDKKLKPAWTNIESNIAKALECTRTLEELAVLALYTQAISHPYMRFVRGPGTEEVNILDLGPLHVEVQDHCRMIIDDPMLLLTPGTESYVLGSLDGLEWEEPEVVQAVHARLDEMPYIKLLLVAFFEGALATWIRFSAEFAPGGLIDTATADERLEAWMPSTNDANEGALGSYSSMRKKKPTLTFHQYNALAMYCRNDTQDFMRLLNEDDHAYLRRRARIIDSSGLERQRRQRQVEFDQWVVKITQAKRAAQRAKIAANIRRLESVILLTSLDQVDGLTVAKLDDQLDALRRYDDGVPLKSKCGNKAKRQEKLREALERYWARIAVHGVPVGLLRSCEGQGEAEVLIAEDWYAQEDDMESEEE